ncbi:MAG: hypothetical protein GY906_10580 [bacterium]|nr:hypothetical protein [bacterium]
MNRLTAIITSFLVLSALPLLAAYDRDQTISAGIDSTHRLDFETALEHFDRIITNEPNSAVGYYFKATAFFWQYLAEDETEEPGDRFASLSERTVKVAKARLKVDRTDHETQLYLGRAYGNLGRYYAMEGKYFKAYVNSKRAKNVLVALTQQHPDCWDAYFELGLYHYYAELAPRVLRALSFILGIEGDRPLGLEELERARQQGEFTKIDATFFLQHINLHYEEDFKTVVALNRELVSRFPTNVVHLSNLAAGFRRAGDAKNAIQTYRRVIEIGKESTPWLEYSLTASYQVARVLMSLNRFEEAIAAFTTILSEEQTPSTKWLRAWSQIQIGVCYELSGDRTKAESFFRQIQRSDNQDAYRTAQQRLKNPLLGVEIENTLALNCNETNRFEEALSILSANLKRLSDNDLQFPSSHAPLIHYYLGRTLLDADRTREAADRFKVVIATDEVPYEWIRPWAHYRLALCFKKLGDSASAKLHFDAAHNLGNKELRLRIERDR